MSGWPTPDKTGPGQESVWDYPRPPAVVPDGRSIEVTHGERLIARSTTSVRVLETSHPPAFYVPPDAVVPARRAEAMAAPGLCKKACLPA